MNTDDRRSTATEELKLLSSIIARIESAVYQKQGWLFTLVTGLTLALLKDNPLIRKGQFAIISGSITIIFFIADIVQRIPVHRAVRRSEQVEGFLAGVHEDYNGPAISKALGQGEGIKESLTFFWKPRVWFPYGGIIVAILIIYISAP